MTRSLWVRFASLVAVEINTNELSVDELRELVGKLDSGGQAALE